MPKVIYEKEGRIGRITLNRPEVMNAIDDDVPLKLADCITRANADTGVHVIILFTKLRSAWPSPRRDDLPTAKGMPSSKVWTQGQPPTQFPATLLFSDVTEDGLETIDGSIDQENCISPVVERSSALS
jgi:hypothetical protein